MNKTISLELDFYKKLMSMIDSDPAKAKEALLKAASPVLRGRFLRKGLTYFMCLWKTSRALWSGFTPRF